MDEDDKETIDLRDLAPDGGDEDLPPMMDASEHVKVYRRTDIGDLPIEFDSISEDVGVLVGAVGMGKILIFAGLTLAFFGVAFELLDRAKRSE